jgi:hypothetical protein
MNYKKCHTFATGFDDEVLFQNAKLISYSITWGCLNNYGLRSYPLNLDG